MEEGIFLVDCFVETDQNSLLRDDLKLFVLQLLRLIHQLLTNRDLKEGANGLNLFQVDAHVAGFQECFDQELVGLPDDLIN